MPAFPAAGRTLLGAGLAIAGFAVGAQPALAAKPARLSAASITGLPATLTPGSALTAKGKVRNTGGRASAALLSFKLRTLRAPYVAVTLGGGRIAKVPARASRSFSTRLTVPAPLKIAAAPDGSSASGSRK